MKLQYRVYKDKDLSDFAKLVAASLANISTDNMSTMVIEGKTHSSANTERLVSHGMANIPSLIIVTEGNAYIQKGSISSGSVDVRSTGSSQSFKLLVIK